ncbi:MAG: ABC transporter permease [Spirochaetales bacterium]|nr:ABC transporter permease [Spirochaetales bacterium]
MRESQKRSAGVWFAAQWESFGLPVLLVVMVVVFAIIAPAFASVFNLVMNVKFSAIVGIGAIGMAFCIMSGDFDISVGSMSALAGVLGASFVPVIGGVGGVLATIAISAFLGFVNGVFVTKLRIPAFITTLGMMYVYRALAYIYTNNTPVYIESTFWHFIANGNILGVPFVIILMAACFASAVYGLRKTPFGRYVVAVGTNKTAAMLSGINVDRIKIAVFTLVGFFVGIATVVLASNLGSVNPGMTGQGYEFQVITVVVLGGTALGGGNGNLLGALFGAMIITSLRNGLGMKQVDSYWQFVATGLVLIFAVALNKIRYSLLGQREA